MYKRRRFGGRPALGRLFYFWAAALLGPTSASMMPRVDSFDWKVVETPHFRLHYYDGAEPIIEKTAGILERSYDRIADRLGVKTGRKFPFYLYLTHNEFEQTNIVPIDEGTGGVTEAIKNRLAIFHDGTIGWLEHVIPHEFVHEMEFSVLFGDNLLLRPYQLGKSLVYPLWLMEGLAEYLALEGPGGEDEMVLGDAATRGILPSLEKLHNFAHLKPHQIRLAYLSGMSVFRYVEEEFGKDKPKQMLWAFQDKFDISAVTKEVLGMDLSALDRKWREWMAHLYRTRWEGRRDPAEYGVRLTADSDGLPDANGQPVGLPDGSIAYFSDERGDSELWLLRPKKSGWGKKRLGGRAGLDRLYENWLDRSPDGRYLVFAGERTQRDYILIYDLKTGGMKKIRPEGFRAIQTPSFAPDGRIVFSGQKAAHFNLYITDREGKTVEPVGPRELTDIRQPRFSPDGRILVYSREEPEGGGRHLWAMEWLDGAGKRRWRIAQTEGPQVQPFFGRDSRRLYFLSSEKDVPLSGLYAAALSTAPQAGDPPAAERLTFMAAALVSAGISLDPAGKEERLVFSAWAGGRGDLYLGPVPSAKPMVEAAPPSKQEGSTPAREEEAAASTSAVILGNARRPGIGFGTDLFLLPLLAYSTADGFFVATFWQGSDMLGNHEASVGMVYRSRFGLPDYQAQYVYRGWKPDLFVRSYRTDVNNLFFLEPSLLLRRSQELHEMGMIYPFHRRLSGIFSVGLEEIRRQDLLGGFSDTSSTRWFNTGLVWDTSDGKWLTVRRGARLGMFWQRAAPVLGGEVRYDAWLAEAARFFSFAGDHTFAFRVLGAFSEGPQRRVFLSLHRGFLQDEFAASKQILATAEFRFPILRDMNYHMAWMIPDFFFKRWEGFVYYEAGRGATTWEQLRRTGGSDIRRSAGFGWRWHTFILQTFYLPMTFDFGFPIHPSGSMDFRFYFGALF